MNFQVMPEEVMEWRISRIHSLVKYIRIKQENDGLKMQNALNSLVGGLFNG